MIKKLILAITMTMALVHGSTDQASSTDTTVTMNEKTKYPVWNTSIGEKGSGESCKDGNCLIKDGKVYKFFTSIRDKVKEQCRKL